MTNAGEGSSSRLIGPPLTPRDAAALSKISEGHTNQRIAHTLGVSLEIIKKDLDSILRKLSASDRTHVVALAIK